jgi:16S rRNA (uracil1498-N3)-methyltransferase
MDHLDPELQATVMSSTPPCFRISSAAIRGDVAVVSGDELHHLRDVLRLREGDWVTLIDERGRNIGGRIESIDASGATIRIDRIEEPRVTPRLILALAIIKGPRMDFAIEKAVELGASEVWPLLCERCVVRDPGRERIARWRRLGIAAGKQSLAARAVEIASPIDFPALPSRVPRAMLPLICQAQAHPLAPLARRATDAGILIACGPEGDFTPGEVSAAERAGFLRAGLGRQRLRTETAALAALAIAGSILDELSGAVRTGGTRGLKLGQS